MMTGRAWFPGSELAGVVTAMITYKGRARALTRQSPVRHLAPRHPKDFADSLGTLPFGLGRDIAGQITEPGQHQAQNPSSEPFRL